MGINKLREYDVNAYNSCYDAAEKLVELCVPENDPDAGAILDDLTNALLDIKITAQNEYNFEYWRTFYNIMLKLADFDINEYL